MTRPITIFVLTLLLTLPAAAWAQDQAVHQPSATPVASAVPARELIPRGQIKNIYVEPMPNGLDQYIRAEIAKKFGSRMTVVLKPEGADAVMVGTGEWKSGTGAAVTGRWLGLHDTATGAVTLIGRDQTTVLWASEAGDRSIWWGALRRGGPRKVADRLVNNLGKAVNEAAKVRR